MTKATHQNIIRVEAEQAPVRDNDVPPIFRCQKCFSILEFVFGSENYIIYKCPTCREVSPKGVTIPVYVKIRPRGEIDL